MSKRGELFVFEGPDGVGKSTLSVRFATRLRECGLDVEHLSFPGRGVGTLGHLVYDLHHHPEKCGIQHLTPASLQTLHIAAHLDAIENNILPALSSGKCVVLDRFWWSTWVYGSANGIAPSLLNALLRAEKLLWRKILPTVTFLITRECSWRQHESDNSWYNLAKLYVELAGREARRYPVEFVSNQDSMETAMDNLLEGLKKHTGIRQVRASGHLDITTFQKKKTVRPKVTRGASAIIKAAPHTTAAFDTYWKFAAERQQVFFRRLAGQCEPWTEDPILLRHKFTNAYRASDRVSQFLIRHVIYPETQEENTGGRGIVEPNEIFFRVLLFKIFNRISTWQAFESEVGQISLEDYRFERYDALLSGLKSRGQRIFSSAYIMPSGSSSFGYSDKHRNYLKLLERMIEDDVPQRLTDLKTMQAAFELILSYPTMGPFLAYQFVTDLNYSPLTDFSETEFVMPGPGARDGIAKCFSDLQGRSEADVIRWVCERQDKEFAQRDIDFQDLWGRPLQLIDCQNLFCEVDKYSRVAHPEIQGLSGRTRIKQLFQPTASEIIPWYPPKWKINQKIKKPVGAQKSNFQNGGGERARLQSRFKTPRTQPLPFAK